VLHTPAYTTYCLKSKVAITFHCQLCSPLHLPTNKSQEVFEKQLCNQNSQYEKYEKFTFTKRKQPHATTESTFLHEWNTKEGTGKSMKNALYILQHAKSISQAKVMLNNIEKSRAWS